jgi:hypothetical protein
LGEVRECANGELLRDGSDRRDRRDGPPSPIGLRRPGRDSTAELRIGSTRMVREHTTAWSLRSLLSLPSLKSLKLHFDTRNEAMGKLLYYFACFHHPWQ